jgi:hypothetical protein
VLCGEILLENGIRFYEVSYKQLKNHKYQAILSGLSGLGCKGSKIIMKPWFTNKMLRYSVTTFLIVAALWLIPLIFLFEK